MASISSQIADFIGTSSDVAERAALLSKCDLVTQMVGEFPELQGEMGCHYAKSSGEADEVAEAIGEHYAPRFAGDRIPQSVVGQVVSLSDRADSLVGIFAAGQKPTGNKDPFALRRAALGLLRILLEADIALPPRTLLSWAAEQIGKQVEAGENTVNEVLGFVIDRLRHFYTDKGYRTELVNAALASPWETVPDLDRRLRSIDAFMNDEAASSLAASNKRIGNILRKSDFDGSTQIDNKLFDFDEESRLFDELTEVKSGIDPLLDRGDYEAALRLLSRLKEPVDRFFDEVMVMDKDPALRDNRLALLAGMKAQFDRIADLSILG